MATDCIVHRIQTERQERKRAKKELGLEDESGRKTRFDDPPETVASGISLGIKPPTCTVTVVTVVTVKIEGCCIEKR